MFSVTNDNSGDSRRFPVITNNLGDNIFSHKRYSGGRETFPL